MIVEVVDCRRELIKEDPRPRGSIELDLDRFKGIIKILNKKIYRLIKNQNEWRHMVKKGLLL